MPRTRPVSTLHLHLRLPDDGEPLRRRIASAIVAALHDGHLGAGDHLPATRALATELGVGRGAVVDAYDELAAAGYVVTRPGAGTCVAAGADAAARAGARPHVPAPDTAPPAAPVAPRPATFDLSPGYPDTALVSPRDWRSSWRATISGALPNEAPSPDLHLRLRTALADHLRRTRGIVASADEIVIVPGVLSALRTLVAAADLVGRPVAFEDPGYARARRVLDAAGVRVRAVAVDDDGLDPDSLDSADAAVYCTPAHQYPMGGRMSVARRARLIASSADAGRIVIEDDYDGEFRYGVAALPALRSIDGGRDTVAYLGTASKIVSPSLRLAWMVPPAPLLARVREALDISGETVSTVTTDAFARFIESGSLTRHLARATRTYTARRQAFVDALRRHHPDVELAGIEAGLHLAVRLPDGVDDAEIAREIGRRGAMVRGLDPYRAGEAGPRGLLCGYARLPESQADAAARLIADVIRTHGEP
ncbi:PLP-dependent aminotransferase family protein [Prescottella agglutinans]|uniref:GntR family transcriptional regulator/MocR family aminotransferase n=1 Tax=Prescottella agglutinans TaxID=1644129 RepID=A0ABT6MCY6_9NOCA|nr:PLP-dependent aminotransferase family protein [Prescottella agglutinans]MDH6282173.1 GntR family transcriptional regulator/MocR family aminotransferase [Prescottella agglutinans]